MDDDHHHHDDEHDHSHAPPEPALRVQALESLLTRKGLVDPDALETIIDTYANRVGPRNGARVVARAWSEPNYRQWLLDDATAAIADMGYQGRQGEHMIALENTDGVHNLVVCTLCSCYPWTVLGIPPTWYKSEAYRSRAVREPRAVLAEFGLTLDDQTEIRLWDSTAEIRYLVIPQRPPGAEDWEQEALADLVTRDSMVGTGVALRPDQLGDAS